MSSMKDVAQLAHVSPATVSRVLSGHPSVKPETSKKALKVGLELLKKGGVMSLCIYSGGDTGFEEKEVLMNYIKELDERKYVVIVSSYYNRKNNPPIPVLIIKK